MYVRQLALTNFRNYVRLGLNLGPGVSVFVGDNAQGKSNLLEAVHVLATTRSPRAGLDRELVSWQAAEFGPAFARLEARVAREEGGGELHVEFLLRAETAEPAANGPGSAFVKTIKVNGLPSRAAQLVGQVTVVWFSPEDVALAAGPPTGRRRYLDITSSQVSRDYLRALQRYNRVLVQRNHLLRQIRERRQRRELLTPWNEEQITFGSQILAQRLRMIAGVNAVVGERFRQLTGSQQNLEVVYTPTILPAAVDSVIEAGASANTLAEAFRVRLAEVAERELDLAVSLVGPHRDDFAFQLDGVDLNTFGSRGQQRLAVLALKLAEAEFIRAETGDCPILLLDDILSELDPARRAFVLEQCTNRGQALITTTDLADLSPSFLTHAVIFRVQAGTVTSASAESLRPAGE